MRSRKWCAVFATLIALSFSSWVRAEYNNSGYDEASEGDYGNGYGPGYGYSSEEDQGGSDSDEPKPKLSNCAWVQSAGPNTPTVSKLNAFYVPSCSDRSGHPAMICGGTARCDVTLATATGEHTFNASFSNTMCAANDFTCPSAEKCLTQGGLLKVLNSELQSYGNRKGKGKEFRFKPSKLNIDSKTHN